MLRTMGRLWGGLDGVRRRAQQRTGTVVAVLALLVTIAGVVVAYDGRTRTHALVSEGGVRNVTRHEPLATNATDVKPGDLVEYVGQAINLGTEPLSNVTIEFFGLPASASSFVYGSCRVGIVGHAPVRCRDRMNPADLHAHELRPGERLEARVRFVVEQPPCAREEIWQRSRADSDETTITGNAWTVIRYDDAVLPACGTAQARLLAAIPTPVRRACDLWRDKQRPRLLRVACRPPGPTSFAVYELYRSGREARRTFALYRASERPTRCWRFSSREHRYTSAEGRYRFNCTLNDDGNAALVWLDERRRVVGYAARADTDVVAIVRWWWDLQPLIPEPDAGEG